MGGDGQVPLAVVTAALCLFGQGAAAQPIHYRFHRTEMNIAHRELTAHRIS